MSSVHTEIISQRAAARRSGISASLIRSLESAGQYPARVQLTEGKSGYIAEEVEQWMRERIELRNQRLEVQEREGKSNG